MSMTTEERLLHVERELADTKAELETYKTEVVEHFSPKPKNLEWRALKNEIREYSERKAESNERATNGYSLSEMFNVLIRFHLDAKNVAQLTDDQIPEARKIFEDIKALI